MKSLLSWLAMKTSIFGGEDSEAYRPLRKISLQIKLEFYTLVKSDQTISYDFIVSDAVLAVKEKRTLGTSL